MNISNALIATGTAALLALAGTGAAGAASEQENRDMERIVATLPDISADDIRPSPLPGIYEISLGSRTAYISADAKYLIQGDLYDVESEENLTEQRRMTARIAALDEVGESKMIIFEPENTVQTITVFTDIDCGYCRKLHSQIDGYNELGIRVRYMFFPRSGPATSSWFKAEEVWCAKDRNSALTAAKAGGVIDSPDCSPTPVAQHYDLGRSFGIQGTPAIIAETGEMIPGYVSPAELVEYLAE